MGMIIGCAVFILGLLALSPVVIYIEKGGRKGFVSHVCYIVGEIRKGGLDVNKKDFFEVAGYTIVLAAILFGSVFAYIRIVG